MRSCRYDLPHDAPARPCLDYHIGRCKAPCVGLQDEADYRRMIDEILRILEGDVEAVRSRVEADMRSAADALEFERAAHLRDVLGGLDALAREQRVQRLGGGTYDVVGLARDGGVAVGTVLRIRRGVLLGRDLLRFSEVEEEDEGSLLASLTGRYYLGRGREGAADLPHEVLLPGPFPDQELLAGVLTDRAGRRVGLRVPERGEGRRLIELAAANARHALEDGRAGLLSARDRADEALFDLQEKLDLKVVPRVMVCFDISHTQGSETVASAVVFQNGEPRKAEYRRMRIRGDWGNDDFRSMEEAVSRWLRRRTEEERPLPDLLLIDGGKGQLSAARSALEATGVTDVALAALAKKEEVVFLPGRREGVRLGRRDRALHLLQRIRDEAHRFAVTYNRKLRRKRTLHSALGEIPGVGPSRQQALLKRFGSLKGVREATPEELARVPGISRTLAARIVTYLGR
ncbi:MAG: excinuclease ABC subunit UvrC [Gemmatimonadetes bacterium]|nr:MAG: excinuclease ABC subunit UvrC [Gemmatimonadota bacterium]